LWIQNPHLKYCLHQTRSSLNSQIPSLTPTFNHAHRAHVLVFLLALGQNTLLNMQEEKVIKLWNKLKRFIRTKFGIEYHQSLCTVVFDY